MIRKINNLNLNWKFKREDEEEAWYKGFDDSHWKDITLPHDWSVEEPFSREHSSGTGYLPGGVGWYRKNFKLSDDLKDKKVFVTFEGIYNNSMVWCNSYYIGKRPYGYSSFTYDLTPFINEGIENVLSVKVNHKDIADSRWFTGSGIYRNVYLIITDKIHIDNYGLFVTTPEVTKEKAVMAIKTKIINEAYYACNIKLENTLLFNNNKICEVDSEIEIKSQGDELVEQNIIIDNPILWSPDAPNLYKLETKLIKDGEVIDNITTPVGIRWFKFDPNEGFYLNGINMKIKGVCVHHDAGCLGAAVPKKVWQRRLEALKEMGCNAIRMSHNPPAPELLDLCDSMGFLVMDEAFDEWEGVKNKWSTGHNVYPPKHYGYYEDFPEWHERDIKDMVKRDRNHPSIILWSIGNEIDYPNDPYCHSYFKEMTGNNDANKPQKERKYDPNKPNAERLAYIAKRLVGFVKECDTTRPVTSALAFPELSNLTGYAEALDIVGYNYKEHLYKEDHEKYPNRVIYGSENGSLINPWLEVKNNPYICAQFIWTGIDYMGEAKGWPQRVAQPGFLNLAGFKKPKFYYRKSLWKEEPIIYLSSIGAEEYDKTKNNRLMNNRVNWNYKKGERVKVICYTNCEEAELFLNNKSLGIKRLSDYEEYYITWDIEFEEGELIAVGKDKSNESISCSMCTTKEIQNIIMKPYNDRLLADGQDITQIEVNLEDIDGNEIYTSSNRIEFTIDGPGEIIGIENGNPEDLEQYNYTNRRLYNGKLIVYLRSKTTGGKIKLKAFSEGLKEAEIEILSF